jgi:hypothetical protein
MKNLKEYYKERLDKIISEGRMHVGKGEWVAVEPRVHIDGERISKLLANHDKPGYVPPPVPQRQRKLGEVDLWSPALQYSKLMRDFEERQNPRLFDREQEAKKAAEEIEAAEAPVRERGRVRNLLNAVHHYSRNFGIELKPEHIKDIDFSTGTFDDHIDQISGRLPSRFSYKIRR